MVNFFLCSLGLINGKQLIFLMFAWLFLVFMSASVQSILKVRGFLIFFTKILATFYLNCIILFLFYFIEGRPQAIH